MNFKMAANNWLNEMTQVVRDIKRHDNKHEDSLTFQLVG